MRQRRCVVKEEEIVRWRMDGVIDDGLNGWHWSTWVRWTWVCSWTNRNTLCSLSLSVLTDRMIRMEYQEDGKFEVGATMSAYGPQCFSAHTYTFCRGDVALFSLYALRGTYSNYVVLAEGSSHGHFPQQKPSNAILHYFLQRRNTDDPDAVLDA